MKNLIPAVFALLLFNGCKKETAMQLNNQSVSKVTGEPISLPPVKATAEALLHDADFIDWYNENINPVIVADQLRPLAFGVLQGKTAGHTITRLQFINLS